MLTEPQLATLKDNERSLLTGIRNAFGDRFQINEKISEGKLFILIPNQQTNNYLELNCDGDLMILGVGEWCHDHPESVPNAIEIIKRIIHDNIIIWKVTHPNGYWYSGFYDVDEWKENKDLVDEPDTGIEPGDKLEKSTFSKTLENRIVE